MQHGQFGYWLKAFLTMIALSYSVLGPQVNAAGQADQTWKVNLKDADIRAFITQIADITGYSFVVDPRVKGKVTVISNAPMTRDEVYEMFLSVLSVHGFAATPGNGVIKIEQINNAKQSAENLRMLRKTPGEQIVTRVIQVNNVNALELVPILRPMVAKYGHLAGVATANALIISDHLNNITRIERIIKELDSPSKYELEVVQLKEAWVGDMVKLLEELAPSELGKAANKAAASKFSVVADERSNRLIIKGDQNFRDKIKLLIAKLDQPAAVTGTTKVIRLKNADAEKLAELLKGLMGDVTKGKDGKAAGGNSDVGIYADEGLNALVVRAEPSVMKEIERIVDQLDVRRAQVLIEAAIVEISDGLTRQLGLQMAGADVSGKSGPVIGTNFSNAGLSISQVLAAIANNSTDVGLGEGVTLGAGKENAKGLSFGVILQALSSTSQANLLSTPSIITMDNQKSEIVVGQNVPFKTGQTSTGTDGTTNPFTTIERKDVGLTLRVTPSISEGDVVRLDIEQETSSVAPSNQDASDIITNKRQIKTSVLADDGETIVLGGLMNEEYTQAVSKVPLLGDIPWLGALFRSTKNQKVKRNLLVFLRPTIVRDKMAAREASGRKYDDLWELHLDIQKQAHGEDETSKLEKPDINSLYKRNRLIQPEPTLIP